MKPRISQPEIFNAALNHFAEKGFEKTTMTDIAESLSVTKGNLYLYAENKKQLYEDSIRYALTKWMNYVNYEVKKSGTVEKQFQTLCFSAYSYIRNDEYLQKIIERDPSIYPIKSDDDRFKDINDAAMQLLEKVIRNGIKEKVFRQVQPRQTALYIYSVYIMFIIKAFVQHDSTADEALFKIAVDMNLKSLLTR